MIFSCTWIKKEQERQSVVINELHNPLNMILKPRAMLKPIINYTCREVADVPNE